MRFLLDHNLPHSLRREFSGHDAVTARYRGWDRLQNGELLAAAQAEFDVLITLDRDIPAQQPTHKSDIALVILVVHPADEASLRPLIAQAIARCGDFRPGRTYVLTA